MGRLARISQMSWEERIAKVRKRAWCACSPIRLLRRFAYSVDTLSLRYFQSEYVEREEYGPANLHTKLERVALGGPFEPLDIALVNKFAVQLAGHPGKVLEIGSGTGMFSSKLVQQSPDTVVVASEFQDETRQWAIDNRSHPNIQYCKLALSEFEVDEFELCVSLDVVEHIKDYGAFLADIARVAPRAILSTPNKARSAFDSVAEMPGFDQHVREWTAGEFYWVLRVFWDDVQLYTVPDMRRQMHRLAQSESYEPTGKKTGVHCRDENLIAVCKRRRPVQ